MARWENWNPPTIEKPKAQVIWDVPYAAMVHEGAETLDIVYPPRPWTDYAIAEMDFNRLFSQRLEEIDLQSIFNRIVNEFIDLSEEAMSMPIWYWPVTTRRFNGQVVPPGERDIYDTGELFDSLVVEYLGGAV